MKVYYVGSKIVQVNFDAHDYAWENRTNNAQVLVIDEIDSANKGICIDLIRSMGRVDISGLDKYYILNGDLYEREGWIERVEEP